MRQNQGEERTGRQSRPMPVYDVANTIFTKVVVISFSKYFVLKDQFKTVVLLQFILYFV